MKLSVHLFFLLLAFNACSQNQGTNETKLHNDMAIPEDVKTETITLGAGCFWCVEAIFQELKGVYKVESGYSGGHVDNPTYKQICYENTGHAEVAQITYDPKVISLELLLEVFWTTHDPTTLNRQGNDVGTQYRSVIFYHNDQQKQIAEKSAKLVGQPLWEKPLVTEISPLINYYPAEDYHQDYYNLNPNQGYCQVIINPKVIKFRKKFADKLKDSE
jgi:peptide-methionine (S)-S-oxide reductase